MLAIDITDNQIKLVEATVAGKIAIKNSASRDLPAGCIENGRIVDMHIVAGEITDILVAENIKDREATICINSGMILYKEIEIPKPKAGSEAFVVESIIQNEMSLGDEYNITYSISGEIATEEGPKLKVIAAACPQRIIDIYLELGRQVGLKTKLMVVSNGCVTRLIKRSAVYKGVSPMLLLQVDKTFININLYNKGALVFSRYTKIDATDYDYNADYVNLAVFDNVYRTMRLLEQEQELAGNLKEIQYFGDIKDQRALKKALQQNDLEGRELEFPGDLVRSKRNFEFLEFANVIGALLKIDPKTENINLLHTKDKRVRSLNMQFGFVALLAAGLCAVLVAGAWGAMQFIESSKHKTLRSLTSHFESLRYAEMQQYVSEKEAAKQTFIDYADAVDTAKVLFHFMPEMSGKIAEQLNSALFPGMHIMGEFMINNYTLSVKFFCVDDTHPVLFTERLIERGYFEDVRFYGYDVESSEEFGEGFTFQLNMRIKGGNRFE